MGSISEQFVMNTAVLNMFPVLNMLLCYVFKNSYFTCGIPINSFWFSGVSHEIKNNLILLLNTAKKKKDYFFLCFLQGERFR